MYLIVYYFFCWKWSKKSKKFVICNHPKHNNFYEHNTPTGYSNTISLNDHEINLYNMSKRNSKSSINCFLINASRLKTLRMSNRSRLSGKSMGQLNGRDSMDENLLNKRKRLIKSKTVTSVEMPPRQAKLKKLRHAKSNAS